MSGRNQSKEIAVKGKEVFVGMEVYKKNWQVTVRIEGEGNSPPARRPKQSLGIPFF